MAASETINCDKLYYVKSHKQDESNKRFELFLMTLW